MCGAKRRCVCNAGDDCKIGWRRSDFPYIILTCYIIGQLRTGVVLWFPYSLVTQHGLRAERPSHQVARGGDIIGSRSILQWVAMIEHTFDQIIASYERTLRTSITMRKTL